ncbi:DUF1990 family protein [Streptomyces capparidis]
MATTFSYAEVGATREGPLPGGYRHLRVRVPVGHGRAVFEAAGRAVLEWRMHRAAGVRMVTDAPRAAPGVRVTPQLGVGPLRVSAPCEVVWTLEEERRAGWAYGTLPGHPERGEEAFLVELDGSGAVTLTVTAFSLPANRCTRAAGPLIPPAQWAYARWCGRTLRALVARRAG